MNKLLALTSLCLLVAARASAAPSIAGLSGAVSHDQVMTILGAGFGVKDPAAPVLWDDGTVNGGIDQKYGDHQPTAATEGAAYNMQYRDAAFLRSRSLGFPHSHMNYVLAGAHACSNIQPAGDCNYNSGSTVHLLVPMPRWPLRQGYPKFYVQYWYRVDPVFDEVCIDNNNAVGCYWFVPGGENCKQLVVSSSPASIFPGEGDDDWGYYQICNGDCPDVNDRTPVKFSRLDSDCSSAHGGCAGAATQHNSPINDWVQWAWVGGYDATYDNPTIEIWTFPDGNTTARMDDGRPLTTFEILGRPQCGQPDDSRFRSVGIGSFARVPRHNKGVNSFRYFAGIYADDTWARVVLTDNEVYENSTIVEPQIPSAWTSEEITARVNLGKLPDGGTAYLFVFDADGNHNAAGYRVTLGGGDTTPPAAPSRLRAP